MAAFERGLAGAPSRGGGFGRGPSLPPRLRPVEELAADPVRGVPDIRLEEAELLVDLDLGDERVHLLVWQSVEHPHGLPVGALDHLRRELSDLLDDPPRTRWRVDP